MSAEPVKLTPEQVARLRVTLVVAAYEEAVVEGLRDQQLWYRDGWPDLVEHFDRVHERFNTPLPQQK